jgi:hypothetical protein
MTGDHTERRVLLKGTVIPVDWDENGSIRTIGILTDDEGEYEVAPGGSGDQLKAQVRSEVLAEADLLNTAGRVKQVRVNSFAILNWVGLGDSIDAPRV